MKIPTLSKAALVVFIAALMTIIAFALQKNSNKSPVLAAGQVSLSSDLVEYAKGIRTLFIVVYDQQSETPMPYGAVRYHLGEDPSSGEFYSFVLTPENLNIMNPNAPKPSLLRIKARLDISGQGGRDKIGDIIGEVTGISPGQQNVVISLSERITLAENR